MNYAEFQCYAIDIQWDKVAKLVALRKGLSYRLKNDLVIATTNPAIVANLIALYNHLDIYHRTLQSKSQAPNTTSYALAIALVLASMASTSSGIAPGLIDLSANHPQLMAEEWGKRMVEGRYYRCGGVRHMARQYPLEQGYK